jgi:hypothetical protein
MGRSLLSASLQTHSCNFVASMSTKVNGYKNTHGLWITGCVMAWAKSYLVGIESYRVTPGLDRPLQGLWVFAVVVGLHGVHPGWAGSQPQAYVRAFVKVEL